MYSPTLPRTPSHSLAHSQRWLVLTKKTQPERVLSLLGFVAFLPQAEKGLICLTPHVFF